MPLLKHAKKKLKQDKKRAVLNKKVKNAYKLAVKIAKVDKNAQTVSASFKAIDKAVKKNLMHKNKAARMKSALSKLVSGKAASSPSTTKTKVKTPTNTKPTPKAKKVAKSKTKSTTKKATAKTSK